MEYKQSSEKPLISVIVPVYNVESYISKCLDSVTGQTYTDIQIILIDDGSTDSSGKICDDYALRDSRIQVVHLEKNSGVSHARNEGLSFAKGDLITFIDADDYVEDTMLERLYAGMEKNRADVAVCGLEHIGNGRYFHIANDGPECVLSGSEAIWHAFNGSLFSFSIGGKIYRRDTIGRLHFDEKMIYGEDSLFLYQVLKNAGKISYMPDKMYYYVIRDGSATQENVGTKRYAAVDFYDRIFDDVRTNFPEAFPVFRQTTLYTNVRRAVEAVEDASIKGQKLWSYLKKIKENLHRYFSLRTLSFHDSKMITAEAILLYYSAFAFWGITIIYKYVKKLLKQ